MKPGRSVGSHRGPDPDALATAAPSPHSWPTSTARQRGGPALLAAGRAEQDKVAQYLLQLTRVPRVGVRRVQSGHGGRSTPTTGTPTTSCVYLWDNADVTTLVFHGASPTVRYRARPRPGGHPCSGSTTDRGSAPSGRRRTRPPPSRARPTAVAGRGVAPATICCCCTPAAPPGCPRCDVAPGRPVRRARRRTTKADAARAGPRRRHRTGDDGRAPQHAGRTADARHRPVQRDDNLMVGGCITTMEGRSSYARGVPRQRRAYGRTRRRSSATGSPSRSSARSTPTRTAGTSRRCGHRLVGRHVVEETRGGTPPPQPAT